jgi:hypothetical protein
MGLTLVAAPQWSWVGTALEESKDPWQRPDPYSLLEQACRGAWTRVTIDQSKHSAPQTF